MAEQYNVRAVEIEAAGFNPVHGEAIIRARLSGGEELQLAFPADDIPRLMFLLSQPGNTPGKFGQPMMARW